MIKNTLGPGRPGCNARENREEWIRPYRLRLVAIRDTTLTKVVRRYLDSDLVARGDTDEMLAHLTRNMGQDLMPVLETDHVHRGRQNLRHNPLYFYGFFAWHIISKTGDLYSRRGEHARPICCKLVANRADAPSESLSANL